MSNFITCKSLVQTDASLKKYKFAVYEKFRQLNYVEHSSYNSKKFKKTCQETLDLYVPLSYSIGIDDIGKRMEDLAFKGLLPKKHRKILAHLKTLNYQESEIFNIKNALTDLFEKAGISVIIYGRIKRPYSIWKKMQSKKVPIHKINDIMAIRIITANISDCYVVLEMMRNICKFEDESFKNYIEEPKENGYQSLHALFELENNKRLEVQIRTYDMHVNAECINASHWFYKYYKRLSK